MSRQVGIEPPKWKDVGDLLLEFSDRFPENVRGELRSLAKTSAWPRKEREFSNYGDVDFIPTERYSREDAWRAIDEARDVVASAAEVIPQPGE